jgi:hypothetical protein
MCIYMCIYIYVYISVSAAQPGLFCVNKHHGEAAVRGDGPCGAGCAAAACEKGA